MVSIILFLINLFRGIVGFFYFVFGLYLGLIRLNLGIWRGDLYMGRFLSRSLVVLLGCSLKIILLFWSVNIMVGVIVLIMVFKCLFLCFVGEFE